MFLTCCHALSGGFSRAYVLAVVQVGTPYYLSPEICEDKPYDQKSDVWSLGCILYEMATLKRAFNGQSLPALVLKILRGKYPPLPARYSGSLKTLVDCLLKIKPQVQHHCHVPSSCNRQCMVTKTVCSVEHSCSYLFAQLCVLRHISALCLTSNL